MKNKDALIGFKLPSELKDRLQKLADADDRSLSSYLVRLIEQSLKNK